MQTQTFETSKGALLVVDLPEGSFGIDINNYADESELMYTVDGDDDSLQKVNLPPGDWQPLGLLKDISEEQADEVVEWVEENQFYVNYLVNQVDSIGFAGDITALESLQSLLETGILLRNPKPHPADIHPTSRAHYDKLSDEWQTAEAEVWKHFYLIFKTK